MDLERIARDTVVEIELEGVGRVDATARCPFTLDSIGVLVTRERGAVLAVMETPRQGQAAGCTVCEGVSLVKYLFQHCGNTIRHRYNREAPLVPRHPLTNAPLTGNVSLFRVHDASTSVVQAHWIGTDAQVPTSEELRRHFWAVCLDDEEPFLALLETAFTKGLPQQQRQELDVPYTLGATFGALVMLYVMLSVSLIGLALVSLIAATDRVEVWFWSFVPFIAFVTDRCITSLFCRQEPSWSLLIKFCFWITYLFFPALVLPYGAPSFYAWRNWMDLVCLPLFLCGSCALYVHFNSTTKLV